MSLLLLVALAVCIAVVVVAFFAPVALPRVIEVLQGLFLVLAIAALLKYLGLVG